MSAEKGSAFLLKIGNGASPPVFGTVAGLRTTQLSINGEAVNITSKTRAVGVSCCQTRACDPCRSLEAASSPDRRRRGD
jgi:hypothetical protein